jgi:hypothetical protein
MKLSIIIPSLMLLAALMLGAFVSYNAQNAQGAAFTGQASYLQIATTTTVGIEGKTRLFAERSDGSCKARVISTRENTMYIIFGDPTNGNLSSTTLTAGTGHFQAASTTVTYDAGIYGCGRWWAIGTVGSTTVTLSEF